MFNWQAKPGILFEKTKM